MNLKQRIAQNTDALAAQMGIADQLVGLTTVQKLANMAVRYQRLSSPQGQKAAALCLQMLDMAKRVEAVS
jgi:hypothetical protein